VIPYITDTLELVFSDMTQLEKSIKILNQLVITIDREDPWVKQHFAISGPGEGLVWYSSQFSTEDIFFLIRFYF
jgi:hypothetical protein